MTRIVKEFKSYNDFNASPVPKKKLASLCATARELIIAFELSDLKIRQVLVEKHESLEQVKNEIEACREARKKTTMPIVAAVFKKRNEKFQESLPTFELASDVFKNITEPVESQDEGDEDAIAALQSQITSLKKEAAKSRSALEDLATELSNAHARIKELEDELDEVDVSEGSQHQGDPNNDNRNTMGLENPTGDSEPTHAREEPVSKFRGTYKLDAKTPVFRSKQDEDIETWLYKIETALMFANVPVSLWLFAVANYVEGTAFEMVMAARTEKKDWPYLKSQLISTFRATFKDFNLRSKLLSLKDTGSYEKYLHDFRYLSNQIPKNAMPDNDRLTCFMQGLRPQTRVELFLKKCTTLEEAILIASTMESVRPNRINDVNFVKFNRNSNNERYKNVKCNKCGRLGHIAINCRVKRAPSSPNYNRNSSGNSFKKPRTSFNNKYNNNGNNSNGNQRKSKLELSCFKCGIKGHYASDCRSTKPTTQNKHSRVNLVDVNTISLMDIVDVNMLTIYDSPKEKDLSLSAKWWAYRGDKSLITSWHKFDKFVLNWCIHNCTDFCHDCYSRNENVDRNTTLPLRCSTHIKDDECFKGSLVRWQDEEDKITKAIACQEKTDKIRELFDRLKETRGIGNRPCTNIEFNDLHDEIYDMHPELLEEWKPKPIQYLPQTPEANTASSNEADMDSPAPDLVFSSLDIPFVPYRDNFSQVFPFETTAENFDDLPRMPFSNTSIPPSSSRVTTPFSTLFNSIEIFNAADASNLKLLTVTAMVTEVGKTRKDPLKAELRCGLDTGATHSILSHRAALKHNINIIKSGKMFKTADGVIQSVIGTTRLLKVDIQGSYAEMAFIVIDHKDHDILLGLDWFDQTGVGFYPGKKILKFPNRPDRYMDTAMSDLDDDQHERTVDLCLAEEPDEIDIDGEVSWEPSPSKSIIKPQAKLTQPQMRIFENIAKRAEKSAAHSLADLGKCNVFKHKIRTTTDEPIFIPAYRKSQSEREEINKQVDEMLKAGIIRRSKSPWSSPIILVPKPNNTRRMCVDYRRLNKITIQQSWPMPRIIDILDRFNGSRYFSALDLKSGFYQVEMEEESIPKTAFSTMDSHFEFLVLPFGLKTAPAAFSRIMFSVLGDLDFVQFYIDDMTIHSKNFEDHMKHIEIILDRLDEAHLRINLEKCVFCAEKVTILGHVVSYNEIRMDPRKIKIIQEWRTPKNVKQVQQFLGLANYYRRHVLNFSKHAASLYNLFKKDTIFIFDSECEKAFAKLKELLTSDPILRPPDFTRPFFLYTDASGYCLGAILGQKDDDGREYVIAYDSRMLKGAELHYSITEKECLGVVWAVKHFRVYLYGKLFTIITDHSSLVWLMNIKDPNGRLARWSLYLQTMEYDIVHRAGRIHSNVDVLSRPVLSIEMLDSQRADQEDSIEKSLDVYENEPFMYFLKHKKHIPGASSNIVKRIDKLSKSYTFDGKEIKYRRYPDENWKIVPPPAMRIELINKAHLIGHFQVQSTWDRLKTDYYWRKMKDQIAHVLRQCEVCARNEREATLNHPAIALRVGGIFDRVGIDLVFGLPETSENYTGVMVITDAFTKFPWAKPIKSKSAVEIASILKEYICIFGPPKTILSDRGREFNNEIVDTMLKNIGIEHRVTSAYNPRTNGLTERMNQSLISALRKHVESDQLSWPKWLDWVLFAYRTRVHSATGFTPFELTFGRKANTFNDWKSGTDSTRELELEVRSAEIKTLFEGTGVTAKTNIAKNQVAQKTIQDNRNNVLIEPLQIGSKVMVKNDDRLVRKLEARYRGPYTVVSVTKDNNYILKDVLGVQIPQSVPLHKLKITTLEDTEQFYEIHKIITHKLVEGKPQYLVDWKNSRYGKSLKASWVKPEDFANMKFINDYQNRLKQLSQRSTRSKSAVLSNLVSILFLIFLMFPVVCSQNKLVIKNSLDFDFCELKDDLFPIDLNDLCTKPMSRDDTSYLKTWLDKYYKKEAKYFKKSYIVSKPNSTYYSGGGEIYHFQASLLSKAINKVSGKGFQCKKVAITRTWSVGFWGKEYRSDEIKTETLDADACWYMVKSKKCEHNIMSCDDNDNCRYDSFPPDEYSWLADSTKSFSHCFLSPKIIAESDLDSHIFTGFCRVSDWFCLLRDSIVVWSKDIFHNCPFKKVSDGFFDAIGQLFTERNQKLGFQFKRFEEHCGILFILTTEGLYIAPDGNLPALDTFDSFADTRGLVDLTLADEDFKALELLNDEKDNLLRECKMFKSMLKIFSFNNDKFMRVNDFKNNEIIVYAHLGQIYFPRCTKIKELNLITKVGCYEELPVTFYIDKFAENGFLSHERIIKSHSKSVVCPNIPSYISLPSSNLTIVILNQRAELTNTFDVKFEKFDLYDQISYKNFSHMDSLLNGVDIIGQMHNLSISNENGGEWMVISDESSTRHSSFGSVITNLVEWFKNGAWYIVKIILLIIVIAGLISILGKLSFVLVKFCLEKAAQRRHNRELQGVEYHAEDENHVILPFDTEPDNPVGANIENAVEHATPRTYPLAIMAPPPLPRRSDSIHTISLLNTGAK